MLDHFCLIQLSTKHKWHIFYQRKLYGYFKVGHTREKTFEHKFHPIDILFEEFKMEISSISHKSYFRGLNVHYLYIML
jgi:hypothetical protein